MLPRPPRSTRTDTLFPYTTLFRSTRGLTGFEALLRWTHPEFGVVPHDKFVQLAEEARLIAPIGEWVLRTACDEAARWPPDVRIAVSDSAEQLHNPHLGTPVAQELSQHDLHPERSHIQVTQIVVL